MEKELSAKMKFSFVLILIIIFLSLLSFVSPVSTADAQSPVNSVSQVSGNINPEDLVQKVDNLASNPEDAIKSGESYLKQEWKKIILNNKILGPIIIFLNPFFRVFDGYEFNLSLEFLIAISISLILLSFYTSGINVFYDNYLISLAIGFLMVIITVSAWLHKKIIPKIIPLINAAWKVFVFVLIIFIIISLLDMLRRYYRAQRKERALENLPETEKTIKGAAKSLESTMEGIKEVKKGYDSAKNKD